MPPGVNVSGLESDGRDRFSAEAARAGKCELFADPVKLLTPDDS